MKSEIFNKLEIVEKFVTISGEAPIIGHPIYLVRFTGCNLNCTYCDTYYKDEINYTLTESELIEDIKKQISCYPYLKVLFTGGEPLLNRKSQIYRIIKKLNHIEFYIETNGSIYIENNRLKNCHFVVDFKTPSSGCDNSFCMDNLKIMNEKDCIKFVVSKDDLCWLKSTVKKIWQINKRIPLYVSPQWNKITLEGLSSFIIDNKVNIKLSFQLHKIIWRNRDRGV